MSRVIRCIPHWISQLIAWVEVITSSIYLLSSWSHQQQLLLFYYYSILALLSVTYASSGNSKTSVLGRIQRHAAVLQSIKPTTGAIFLSLQVESIPAKRGILNLHTVTLVLLRIIQIKVLTVDTTFAGKGYQKMPVLAFHHFSNLIIWSPLCLFTFQEPRQRA